MSHEKDVLLIDKQKLVTAVPFFLRFIHAEFMDIALSSLITSCHKANHYLSRMLADIRGRGSFFIYQQPL